MSTRLHLKNKDYLISSRNYLDDYSNYESKRIDMTLSGKFLSDYPSINVNIDFDKYPSKERADYLISLLGITKYSVTLGPASNGILQNIIKILFINKGNLVTPFYTFNQAEYATTAMNGETRRVYTSDYKIDLDRMYSSIDKNTKLIYICNPNNPTGEYIDPKKLIEFSKKVKPYVLIDESSIDYTNNKSILDYKLPKNIIVLRTFSKAYGLANLRIGYMVSSEKFKELYVQNTTVNEYSGISVEYAINMIKKGSNKLNQNIKKINKEKDKIINGLNKISFLESSSNLLMTRSTFNKKIIDKLEKHNVSLVYVFDENNKLHLRIAIQEEKTNDEFIYVMKEVIKYEDFLSN